jgi:two-component system NtrC family sensor kinase
MKRPTRAGREPVKTRRRKTVTQKRSNAPRAARRGNPSAAGLQAQLERQAHELTETRELQAATAEVLRIISTSPHDIQPVFDIIAENAVRICQGQFSFVVRFDNKLFRFAACHGLTFEGLEAFRRVLPRPAGEDTAAGRAILHRAVVQIPDVLADPAYGAVGLAQTVTYRSILAVPMLRDGNPIGAIAVPRAQVGSFSRGQVALLQTFARQAVIAIENVRLFEAEQQRSRELTESLEQQTATSEVLRVISSSPGELEPVFQAMLANAVRICDAKFGFMNRYDGDTWKIAAIHGAAPAYTEYLQQRGYKRPGPETVVARIAKSKQMVHIADLAASRGYAEHDPVVVAAVELGNVRTLLGVPMLKEDELIGAILLYRQEVRPFTDKQIALVQNFAAQAVIAIENTRLLNELQQSLQQQTATADVLKVISRSTFDLKAVLNTLVESAARLCEADMASIPRQTGAIWDHIATYGYNADFRDFLRRNPFSADRGSVTGRAVLEGTTVHVPDVLDDPEYSLYEGQKVGGYRTVLAVPLMREGTAIGVLVLARSAARPFTAQQIELVETFADQAAIAIENARLFEAEQQRTRELAKSLEDLQTAQDRLVQTQKLASLGQLTAGIAHEIKNPLNFVNNFSGVSVELIDELKETLGHIQADEKTRADIDHLANTLRDNLDKIVQHGKRADSIVKNMLLHSREGSGEHRPVEINALVEDSLNLAYHGARAEKQGFEITLKRSFDPAAGEADVFPQEITRALLNLISNGFYAATKRKSLLNNEAYQPALSASTKNLGDRVEIRIRDNGTGIPPEVRDKMFNPFFTTKPAGEGTGLGLSISHDIIVKQHAGSIEVDTQPYEFTEIRIVLPRATS